MPTFVLSPDKQRYIATNNNTPADAAGAGAAVLAGLQSGAGRRRPDPASGVCVRSRVATADPATRVWTVAGGNELDV